MHYIGITIDKLAVTEDQLKTAFNDTCVNWKASNQEWCLWYSDCICNDKFDACKVALSNNSLQHFINTLKRVRDDSLYNSYNDNLGLHHISDTTKTTVKHRIKIKPKFNFKVKQT